MKKFFYSTVTSLLLTSGFVLAYSPPSEMGDVVGRNMGSSKGMWLAKYGHVGIYDSGLKKVLEVTNESPAIQIVEVTSFTHKKYWGAHYGIGSKSQHRKALDAGHNQKYYAPKYSFSPYFQEGRWMKTWVNVPDKFWRRGKWIQKWVKGGAKFRCDSFVQYCYEKGVGTRLVKKRWQTLPRKVFNALPRERRPIGVGIPTINIW